MARGSGRGAPALGGPHEEGFQLCCHRGFPRLKIALSKTHEHTLQFPTAVARIPSRPWRGTPDLRAVGCCLGAVAVHSWFALSTMPLQYCSTSFWKAWRGRLTAAGCPHVFRSCPPQHIVASVGLAPGLALQQHLSSSGVRSKVILCCLRHCVYCQYWSGTKWSIKAGRWLASPVRFRLLQPCFSSVDLKRELLVGNFSDQHKKDLRCNEPTWVSVPGVFLRHAPAAAAAALDPA